MTDEGLVPEALPEDEESLKALTEAGQLGVVEATADVPEEAFQDPPNEPDAPEEEPAEAKSSAEYRKVFNAWVAAGKPRKFDSGKVRYMAIEEAGAMKFVVAGPKSGMESYGSLSIGGR